MASAWKVRGGIKGPVRVRSLSWDEYNEFKQTGELPKPNTRNTIMPGPTPIDPFDPKDRAKEL